MTKTREVPLPPKKSDLDAKARKTQTDMIGFILAKVAEMTAQQIKRGPEDAESLEAYIKTVEHGLNGLRNAREALTKTYK